MIQLQNLNYILTSGDKNFILDNNLTEEFFSDYKEEFLFIKNFIQSYNKVPDQVTFLSNFSEFDIIKVNESRDFLIDQLYEDRNKRKLAETFNNIRSLLNSNKTKEAMELFTTSANLAVTAKHMNSVDITKDISRYDDYVERCNDKSKFYISTGFPELDKVIGGWDREEEYATIAARPGVGKSWVLLKVALAALEQGLRVGLYSGEMSDRKVGYRFDTLVSHISNFDITRGEVGSQNSYKKYIDNLPNKYTGCLKVLTPQMIGEFATVSTLRAFIERENLDIICIDQHSLLEDELHGRTAPEKAANISRSLKKLQETCKIPIITVSQQNRAITDENNGADSSNIAQSDRISQDSTILIFLEQEKDILTLNLSKSRDSSNNKKIKYSIDLNKGFFQYIPEQSNAISGEGSEELRQMFEEDPGEEVF